MIKVPVLLITGFHSLEKVSQIEVFSTTSMHQKLRLKWEKRSKKLLMPFLLPNKRETRLSKQRSMQRSSLPNKRRLRECVKPLRKKKSVKSAMKKVLRVAKLRRKRLRLRDPSLPLRESQQKNLASTILMATSSPQS